MKAPRRCCCKPHLGVKVREGLGGEGLLANRVGGDVGC